MPAPVSYPFDPDWCMAPAVHLREWLEENGLTPATASAAVSGSRQRHPEAHAAVQLIMQGVLDKVPIDGHVADLLERVTQIPSRMWLALEHNYRDGLAAGKKDITDDHER